jgi:hypothetical protein
MDVTVSSCLPVRPLWVSLSPLTSGKPLVISLLVVLLERLIIPGWWLQVLHYLLSLRPYTGSESSRDSNGCDTYCCGERNFVWSCGSDLKRRY